MVDGQNLAPLICGLHPLVLVARPIFRPSRFRPRPETIFHLQWTKYICIASLNLHEGFIWQNAIRDIGARRCHRGTFVLLREGDLSPNPAILLPIVCLNIISLLFPNMLATSNQIESHITKKNKGKKLIAFKQNRFVSKSQYAKDCNKNDDDLQTKAGWGDLLTGDPQHLPLIRARAVMWQHHHHIKWQHKGNIKLWFWSFWHRLD